MAKVRLLDFASEASELRALRMCVLYLGLDTAKSLYPGDENAVHIGAFDDAGILIGIASLFRREDGSLQLRGMATSAEARGTGAGRDIVRFAEAYAIENQLPRLWCNARVAAMGFYEKCGWRIEGSEFEVPDIGAHYVMLSTADEKTVANG
ncbi:MAG: GNAT family N-acetyltransferase [Fibrella sp.]|nr:GNAT family N-acetyltransferase [Armatimonadota bacterium]